MSLCTVICNKSSACIRNIELIKKFNEPCGGAIPHLPNSECDHCVYDPSAKCIDSDRHNMIALLRKWMYEMGSLEQHDYDAMCIETEKLLKAMNVNLDD